MQWFPFHVNQVNLLWKSPWPPPEQEHTSGVAEMCDMLISRAQANAVTREGIPLQIFTRQFLATGKGVAQSNKTEVVAGPSLNHGVNDCPLLGTLHFILLTCLLLGSLDACPGREVNYGNKHFYVLGFEHLHE